MIEFVRTDEGVHIIAPMQGEEFTLCGIAFDAAGTERDETLRFRKTKSKIVTCAECIRIIKVCKQVNYKEQS